MAFELSTVRPLPELKIYAFRNDDIAATKGRGKNVLYK
jgi:hypothetical protein